ncbi:MAG: heavy-metal-associated domain-containing protein [Treponema sp.]|nr:heavy-metal-associated domain-containing protein [Treponema sp.]
MLVNVIIVLIIIVGVLGGIKSFLKRATGKGCCAGGDAIVKIAAEDTDKSHYPYRARASVDGMTCKNCAVRVENALNNLDGVWATVDLKKHTVSILLKERNCTATLMDAVARAGYALNNVEITDA